MPSNSTMIVVCTLIAFVAWYYYNKFQESEKEYFVLHRQFESVCANNKMLKEKVSDLQLYKDDVSKTFKILDNELVMINDHIQKRSVQPNRSVDEILQNQTGRISLLTPDVLSSLFATINQEPTVQIDETEAEQQIMAEEEEQRVHFVAPPSEYDEFKMANPSSSQLSDTPESRLAQTIKASNNTMN